MKFDRKYRHWLTRLGRARGLRGQDAEDLASDVIVIIVRKIVDWKYDRSLGGFRAYLETILRNAVTAHAKQTKKRGSTGSPLIELIADKSAMNSVLDVLEKKDDAIKTRIVINEIRSKVSEAQWNAWHLTVEQKLSSKEAAERLGTTAGNVDVMKHRFEKLTIQTAETLFHESD